MFGLTKKNAGFVSFRDTDAHSIIVVGGKRLDGVALPVGRDTLDRDAALLHEILCYGCCTLLRDTGIDLGIAGRCIGIAYERDRSLRIGIEVIGHLLHLDCLLISDDGLVLLEEDVVLYRRTLRSRMIAAILAVVDISATDFAERMLTEVRTFIDWALAHAADFYYDQFGLQFAIGLGIALAEAVVQTEKPVEIPVGLAAML